LRKILSEQLGPGQPPGGAAIALRNFIDTLTPFEDTVWSLQIAPQARVLKIGAPEGWQELVRRFPRDVAGTHEGESPVRARVNGAKAAACPAPGACRLGEGDGSLRWRARHHRGICGLWRTRWDDISDGWTPDEPVNAAGSKGADS
jgi:hypothetical protein